jgi:hypothetical protein
MARNVDLSLAVNYLPACECLGKMLIFMLWVAWIQPGGEVDAYISLASILYMDRVVTRNMIFDANAILLAVYFANVQAQLRAVSQHRAYPVLVDCMFLLWAMGSVVLIAEPAAVKSALERRPRANKLGAVILMLLIVPAIAHFHAPLETGGVRGCRAVAFTLLAFAWIYIVGIHTPHGIEYLKENSSQFVARLAPVLYSTLWIAVLFCLAAVAGLVMQYLRLVGHTDKKGGAGLESPSEVVVEPPRQDEADAEELFRMARMQSLARSGAGPARLEPILESVVSS